LTKLTAWFACAGTCFHFATLANRKWTDDIGHDAVFPEPVHRLINWHEDPAPVSQHASGTFRPDEITTEPQNMHPDLAKFTVP
jgi:hypothetical protein